LKFAISQNCFFSLSTKRKMDSMDPPIPGTSTGIWYCTKYHDFLCFQNYTYKTVITTCTMYTTVVVDSADPCRHLKVLQ
jgi:hypothetical protein